MDSLINISILTVILIILVAIFHDDKTKIERFICAIVAGVLLTIILFGTKHCPNCKTYSLCTTYCSQCGKDLRNYGLLKHNKKWSCPNCKKNVNRADKYCQHCGTELIDIGVD